MTTNRNFKETDPMNPSDLTAVINPYDALAPIFDALLVRPLSAPTMSLGGIHLPDTSQETFSRGVVEKIGPDVKALQAGDLILFGKYAGTWVTLAGRDRLAMKEVEVFLRMPAGTFAVIEHDDAKRHLDGEPCDECAGVGNDSLAPTDTPATSPEDVAARERLRKLREQLHAPGAESAEG